MIFLGIDISPAGTHALALDLESASVLADCHEPHPWMEHVPDGSLEQQPMRWIEAIDRAVRSCLAAIPQDLRKVAAIGVGSCLQGVVILDHQDRVIRPCKMPGDASAKTQAEEIARAFGGNPGLIELIGQSISFDSAAAQCLWLKRHEPDHFSQIARVFSLKDFINYWLTGEAATDAGIASASGLWDIRRRRWSEEICDLIDPTLIQTLAPLRHPLKPLATLRKSLAEHWGIDAQALVSLGSGSPMLSCLSAGCASAGEISLDWSGCARLMGISPEPCIDLRGELLALCDATGQWISAGITTHAIGAPEMICRHYGWSITELESMIRSSPPGADGLLFLPYINSEKKPHLPEATGVLHGVTYQNFTPAHLARATVEGVMLDIGYHLERMQEQGFHPAQITVTGKACQSQLTRELLADVFGVPVIGISSHHSQAHGAAIHSAMMFFQHNGETLPVQDLARYFVRFEESTRCEPRPSNHALYQELISRQQYLVDTLHPAGFL